MQPGMSQADQRSRRALQQAQAPSILLQHIASGLGGGGKEGGSVMITCPMLHSPTYTSGTTFCMPN